MQRAQITDRLFSCLRTAVIVARIEDDDIALSQIIFPVFTGQIPFPALHKPDHIMIMKMIGKRLYNTLQQIRFYPQLFIINDRPYFFFHSV